MRPVIVRLLSAADRAVDWLAYRPAVVRLFLFLPRWWNCDLARLSIRLDERWNVGYWTDDSWWPGPVCEACGRRTARVYVGGLEEEDEPIGFYLDTRRVDLCLWCDVGPTDALRSETDLRGALERARSDSVSWRWSLPRPRTS
jgi:hypothetical protein